MVQGKRLGGAVAVRCQFGGASPLSLWRISEEPTARSPGGLSALIRGCTAEQDCKLRRGRAEAGSEGAGCVPSPGAGPGGAGLQDPRCSPFTFSTRGGSSWASDICCRAGPGFPALRLSERSHTARFLCETTRFSKIMYISNRFCPRFWNI